MNAKKYIASVLMLLIYSVGIAHSSIPHCEQLCDVQLHTEVGHSGSNHDHHIQHENHCDEDIFDLVTCFLHSAGHALDHCDEPGCWDIGEQAEITLNKTDLLQIALLVVAFVELPEEKQTAQNWPEYSDQAVNGFDRSNIGLRAPPSIGAFLG